MPCVEPALAECALQGGSSLPIEASAPLSLSDWAGTMLQMLSKCPPPLHVGMGRVTWQQ